jgi:lipid-A-disaccharide synthase-like uncharacterized protein
MMNETILEVSLPLINKALVITPWKIIGVVGALMFAARWFVQAWASKKAGRSVVPMTFWFMSVTGSTLTLAYFVFGKNDAVGILQNISPFFLALYNIWLELKQRKMDAL